MVVTPLGNIKIVHEALLDISEGVGIQTGTIVLTEFLNCVGEAQHNRICSIVFRLKLSLDE